MARERLSSRLGFILLSAGCAIGCGNVWKFPWMVGQNGGGAFVLVYLAFLVVLGLPALTMEFALGRASQASPVRMYQELEKPGSKWHIHGYVCLLGNIFLMAFYTVVTGWLIYYFVSFVAGKSGELSFAKMISSPEINVGYLFIAVALCFLILTRNLQSGLERITKYMMVLLLVLMTVLAVRSISLPGGAKGLSFYLVPDFKKLTVPVVVGAMNQAFFTLSLGIGAMSIFGSYIGKDRSLMGESVKVIILDTFVAVTAGLIIFPACASFEIAVDAGPSLLFNTMTTVFNNMGGGRVWGSLFFLFMVFAAFSTELAVCENILACVREMTGWSRRKGCIICGTGIFLIALTTALGYSVFHFHPFGEGSAWLDFWDFIVSNNLLPLGALIFAVFSCSSRFGLGWEKLVQEANEGEGLKVKNWMKPVFAYFVPLCIIAIYIIGLATFKWR
ncbi:sodium-dependent transporter [uncultured Treponema sp.]|uniref:sodium-dependent transporter n=1 Tax=uncultured Treponema sp. TaxID=162155 RepID=UPI0025D3B6C3|nr:sodium-dependent transporter [uncultured Treponema sp.]